MSDNLILILASTPEDSRSASSFKLPIAHMAYKIGSDLTLLKRSVGMSQKGGFMLLSDDGYSGSGGSYDALCREIARENKLREYTGLICDFEGDIRPELGKFIEEFDARNQNTPLLIRERYSAASKRAHILVASAVTGGSYKLMLSDWIERNGKSPALEITPLFHDYRLPVGESPTVELGQDGLAALFEKYDPLTFFSSELSANYFTYKDFDGDIHFVLFDDARSIAAKLRIAAAMNCRYAVALFPEIRELLPDLLNVPLL